MAKQTSKLPELKKQIKENKLKGIYLLYGEEVYLKKVYLKQMTEMIDYGGFEDFNLRCIF